MKYHIVKEIGKETLLPVWSAHEAGVAGKIGMYVCGTTTPDGSEKCKEMLRVILANSEQEIVETVEI